MPFKPKVPCKYPLCPEVINPGERYCSKHKHTEQTSSIKRSSCAEGYDRKWQRLRAYKLRLDPLCEICLAMGEVVQAEEVDHIKPVKQYPELRLVLENTQSLCVSHHSKKTREENKK